MSRKEIGRKKKPRPKRIAPKKPGSKRTPAKRPGPRTKPTKVEKAPLPEAIKTPSVKKGPAPSNRSPPKPSRLSKSPVKTPSKGTPSKPSRLSKSPVRTPSKGTPPKPSRLSKSPVKTPSKSKPSSLSKPTSAISKKATITDTSKIEKEEIEEREKEAGFKIGELGAPEKELPTVPQTIKIDKNGNFNFSLNIQEQKDVKFYIEVYKKGDQSKPELTKSKGIILPSQRLLRNELNLELLFSTKECYEGTWGPKKISLDKKKQYKALEEFLKKENLIFEWKSVDTPPPEAER